MTYSELQAICEKKKMQVKEVKNGLEMSYTGLRDALNKDTLPVRKIETLCKILGMSPNEFFKWGEKSGSNYEQIGVMNTQNVGLAGMDILREQLQKKDEQIAALLALLNK